MANSVWQGTVQDASGNIVTGAEVSVYDEGTGTLATIYSDIGGTALTNPFFSDANGFAQFYAAAGQYRITAVEAGSGLNQTFRHVRLGEAGSVDTGTASDEVPLNSSLADVLRDSDIGQTVAGLTSPGATNWDSGNLSKPATGGGIVGIDVNTSASQNLPSGGTFFVFYQQILNNGNYSNPIVDILAGGSTISAPSDRFFRGYGWRFEP